MWQRFTERARKVIYYAQEEATRLNDDVVAPEHILLGLLRDESTVGFHILQACGGSAETLRAAMESHILSIAKSKGGDMTLTTRAKRVIDLSYDEARNLNNNYIGTEHLLLGLVREGESFASRTLAEADISLEETRKETLAHQGNKPYEKPEPQAPPPKPMPLGVSYDLHLLHPVDQVLLALLSDTESELGQELRKRFPNLDAFLPSVLAAMARDKATTRASLSVVLSQVKEMKPEHLYIACLQHTTVRIQDVLKVIGIDPFE